MPQQCPECSATLQEESRHGVAYEECPACAGIWIGPDALKTLLALEPEALGELGNDPVPTVEQKAAGPSTRLCPTCQTGLQQYHYMYDSPIVLDACTTCGGFFAQHDELSKMQDWLDRSRGPMSTDEQMKETIGEATIEHDAEMDKQRRLTQFFGLLNRNAPGWLWFVP